MRTAPAKVLRFAWDSVNNMTSPTVRVTKRENGCGRGKGDALTKEVLTKNVL
jgi:hypothetical protein